MALKLLTATALVGLAQAVPEASAWSRTKCGSPQGGAANTDIITEVRTVHALGNPFP